MASTEEPTLGEHAQEQERTPMEGLGGATDQMAQLGLQQSQQIAQGDCVYWGYWQSSGSWFPAMEKLLKLENLTLAKGAEGAPTAKPSP